MLTLFCFPAPLFVPITLFIKSNEDNVPIYGTWVNLNMLTKHLHSQRFIMRICYFVGDSGLVCVVAPAAMSILQCVPVLVCPWSKVTYLRDTCAPSTDREPSEISKQTQMEARRGGRHVSRTLAGKRRGLWGIMVLSYPPLFLPSAPSLSLCELSKQCKFSSLNVHSCDMKMWLETQQLIQVHSFISLSSTGNDFTSLSTLSGMFLLH